MRTIEDIKKGFECCFLNDIEDCDNCPYLDDEADCYDRLAKDIDNFLNDALPPIR